MESLNGILVDNLVGKRLLLKLATEDRWRNTPVTEYMVKEVSPSGKWIKLRDLHGSRFWVPLADVNFVEELED